jgi:hypothetical protein
VEELEEVADKIVGVLLLVGADGAGIRREREIPDRLVIMVELGGADGGVLAAGGLDQAVEGVVGVEVFGRNEGVVVEEALLGVVLDADGVADGVEFVAQVLEGVARGHPGRGEALQAEGKLVVLVLGGEGGAAAPWGLCVLDAGALAFGVVVEVFDDWRRGGGAAQVDAEGLEEAGLVVEGLEEGVVGGADRGNPVEGVDSDAPTRRCSGRSPLRAGRAPPDSSSALRAWRHRCWEERGCAATRFAPAGEWGSSG